VENDPGITPIYDSTTWKEGMSFPGSKQLGLAKKLLEQYPWWRFESHPEWVEPGSFAAGIPGVVRIIYMPKKGIYKWEGPRVESLEPDAVFHGYYFDPVSGRKYPVDHFSELTESKQYPGTYTTSAKVNSPQDWVLVLEYDKSGDSTKNSTAKKSDSSKVPDQLKSLIGKWKVTVGSSSPAEWIFNEDGTIESSNSGGVLSARWKAEEKRVFIQWNETAWESLNLPINPDETKGDSWQGKGLVTARKEVGVKTAKASSSIPVTKAVTGNPDNLKKLIGKWYLEVGPDFKAVLTFHEDGTVDSSAGDIQKGKWKAESYRIFITWDEDHWDSLNFPLNPSETHGDSWVGQGEVSARKLEGQ